jgi:hypothetical protein
MPGLDPLRRFDRALIDGFRRLGRSLLAPAVGLARWEHARAPAPVAAVARRPTLVAVLAGAVVVAGSAVHLDRFPDRDPEDEVAGTPQAPDEVGPPAGADIASYADRRHERLRELDADTLALDLRAVVSFEETVAIGALPVPDGLEVERVQVLLPGELEPRELDADGVESELETLFEAGREDVDEEIAELEALLAEDIDDPAFEEEFETELARLRTLRDQASTEAPVVFAAVVVGPGTALQELIDAPGIRLVDAAGDAELTRGTRMVGVPPRSGDAGDPPR